jgi:hypothetical protein
MNLGMMMLLGMMLIIFKEGEVTKKCGKRDGGYMTKGNEKRSRDVCDVEGKLKNEENHWYFVQHLSCGGEDTMKRGTTNADNGENDEYNGTIMIFVTNVTNDTGVKEDKRRKSVPEFCNVSTVNIIFFAPIDGGSCR